MLSRDRATLRRRDIVMLQPQVKELDKVINYGPSEDDAEGPQHHAKVELESTLAGVTRA